MKRTLAYIRVSTTEQASEGVSLDAQAERLRAYCLASGLDLVELIREEGVSGAVPLGERPEGRKLVELIGSKGAAHVVALKLDRLFRDAADALTQTRVWDRLGVSLHLVDVGGQTINTSSAMGRMFLTMMAGFAELERNLIAERTASALQHKKRRFEVYSPAPLGYDATASGKLLPNPEELEIVSLIQAARDRGSSFGAIAEDLNATGYRGKKGGRFYASTIRHIVNNSLYREAA